MALSRDDQGRPRTGKSRWKHQSSLSLTLSTIGTVFQPLRQPITFSVPFRNTSMAVLVEKAPSEVKPYMKLMRIDKPIGKKVVDY